MLALASWTLLHHVGPLAGSRDILRARGYSKAGVTRVGGQCREGWSAVLIELSTHDLRMSRLASMPARQERADAAVRSAGAQHSGTERVRSAETGEDRSFVVANIRAMALGRLQLGRALRCVLASQPSLRRSR
jgi:hypothetical protein